MPSRDYGRTSYHRLCTMAWPASLHNATIQAHVTGGPGSRRWGAVQLNRSYCGARETVTSSSRQIVSIAADAPIITEVIKLADANTRTLGFVPEDALRQAATRGEIFGLVGGGGDLLGYAWYRVTQATDEARLHHLCVRDGRRHEGIGQLLIQELKRRTQHLRGITLRCRRDNPACEFYHRAGFVPFGERPGRGKDAQILTKYSFYHDNPDLEAVHRARLAETKAVAVLDANVFFDLHDPDSPTYGQSKSLCAEWITDIAALWITPELYAEINRNPDSVERKRLWGAANAFPVVHSGESRLLEAQAAVAGVMPPARSTSDQSDRLHLAAAVAFDADYFVTRDRALRDHGPNLAEACGIEVVTPLEFVLNLHETQRRAEYHPAKLAGSGLTIKLVTAAEVSGLRQAFMNHGAGETKHAFESRLSTLCNREDTRAEVVRDGEGAVALVLTTRVNALVTDVAILRTPKHGLAPTISRHLLARALRMENTGARNERATAVILSDPYCSAPALEAARELGFLPSSDGLMKIGIRQLASADTVATAISSLARVLPSARQPATTIARVLSDVRTAGNSDGAIDRAERLLWPLKLDYQQVPCFMVPIRARWAAHLFDEALAAQHLIDVDAALALQYENVYYRAPQPGILRAPGRVLWYVGSDSAYSATAQIRACSHIAEVVVGPAKDLYRRFSRLGVYTWRDVLSQAGDDPQADIMAFRFCATEMLPHPIVRREVRRALCAERGRTPQFTTALALSRSEFAELYKRGCGY